MRGLKYITLLLALFFSVSMQGQFNPSNPAEPGYYYTLNLEASPSKGGSVSCYDGYEIEAGAKLYISAYPNNDYRFKCWKEEGEVISTERYFTYTMPERDVYLTAEFEFYPSSPDEPEFVEYSRIKVLASPSKGGSFYFDDDAEYEVGKTVSLTAYCNNGYKLTKWTENGVTISTSRYLDYMVTKGDHELIAHFEFDPYSPDEPEEPEITCNIYGLNVKGKRGETVSYPVYLENTGDITGCAFNMTLPEGFVLNKDNINTTDRTSDHILSVTDIGNGKYHISLKGSTPFKDFNGSIMQLSVTIPESAKMETRYDVMITDGEVYGNDVTSTGIPCKNGSIYINSTLLDHTMSLTIPKGWSWISSNFNDPKYLMAKDFIKPFEEYVERIIGRNAELLKDPDLGLTGNLKELSPAQSYIIKTKKAVSNEWHGNAFFPEDVVISLKKGWNWIGYVPTMERPLAEALQTLSASEGDVIKDYDNFATYTDGTWTGTLTSMQPGKGYMYRSATAISFSYPSNDIPVTDIAKMHTSSKQAPWNINKNAYPFNMSVIAEVHCGDSPVEAGRYTVGAFAGSECRGIGSYVGNLLFVTIYGNAGDKEKITFKAFDNVSGEEYVIAENIVFEEIIKGSTDSPLILTVTSPTGITSAPGDVSIDVMTDHSILYVTGATNSITKISVISSTGMVMLEEPIYTASGINIATLPFGAYIVRVTTPQGTVVKKIMKEK